MESFIKNILQIAATFSPLFFVFCFYKAVQKLRLYHSSSFRQKCIRKGMKTIQETEQQIVTLKEKIEREQKQLLPEIERRKEIQELGEYDKENRIKKELGQLTVVDKLLLKKQEEQLSKHVTAVFLGHMLTTNTPVHKYLEILKYKKDIRKAEKKKLEKLTISAQKAEDELESFIGVYSPSVLPYKSDEGYWFFRTGYNDDTYCVFPFYYTFWQYMWVLFRKGKVNPPLWLKSPTMTIIMTFIWGLTAAIYYFIMIVIY